MPVRKIVEIFLFRVLLGLFFVVLLFLLGNLAKIMTAYAVISQVLFLFLQVVALLVGLVAHSDAPVWLFFFDLLYF